MLLGLVSLFHDDNAPSRFHRRISFNEISIPMIAQASVRTLASIIPRTTRLIAIRANITAQVANAATTEVFLITEDRVRFTAARSILRQTKNQSTGMSIAAVKCPASSDDAQSRNREPNGTSNSAETNSAGALIPKASCSFTDGGPSTHSGQKPTGSTGATANQDCTRCCHGGSII